MGLRRGAVEAIVVPDEETRLALGRDVVDHVATADAGRARLLLLPERVPGALVAAVRSAWDVMGAGRRWQTYGSALTGVRAEAVLDGDGGHDDHHEEHGDHGDHEGHGGGHDHGDMMAITGSPSADGLVMEDLDVRAGPLGVALPGGLVVEATLDGDVVADCTVQATLRVADGGAPPDPWSAMAWTAAEMAARERFSGGTPDAGRWFRVAALEVERAVGHLAWLHGFCRLLAWAQMTERVRGVLADAVSLRDAMPAHPTTPDLPDVPTRRLRAGLADVQAAVWALTGTLEKSRSFARRTTGLGHLGRDEIAARGLDGPVARASGVAEDTRMHDPGYALLGFEPVVRDEGDARARALLRVAEAAQALELAATAIGRSTRAGGAEGVTPLFGRAPGGVAESGRGPVRVTISADGETQHTAHSARAARLAAGELAIGREWAAALVTVASFDLSPWRVGP